MPFLDAYAGRQESGNPHCGTGGLYSTGVFVTLYKLKSETQKKVVKISIVIKIITDI